LILTELIKSEFEYDDGDENGDQTLSLCLRLMNESAEIECRVCGGFLPYFFFRFLVAF